MPRVNPPSYRRKRVGKHVYAVVGWRDPQTGKLREISLGRYGSEESRAAYETALSQWRAGRRAEHDSRRTYCGMTIASLVVAYTDWLVERRVSAGFTREINLALRLLVRHHGSDPIDSFGPVALRKLRALMREAEAWTDLDGKQHVRSAWSRRTATGATAAIARMFRYAVAHELLPEETYRRLKTIEPLPADEHAERVTPAPADAVEVVRTRASRQVRGLIDLQLATGMRSGEAVIMRPCDIDMRGLVWVYTPTRHKTQHRGKDRRICIGPRGQDVLRPFLAGRATTAYVFSPAEAAESLRERRRANRKTPLSCGNRAGLCRTPRPSKGKSRRAGDHYTPTSYARAIAKACEAAGVEHWHPHQLRHAFLTEVEREFGLYEAQVAAGHASANVTAATYVHRDLTVAKQVAAKIG